MYIYTCTHKSNTLCRPAGREGQQHRYSKDVCIYTRAHTNQAHFAVPQVGKASSIGTVKSGFSCMISVSDKDRLQKNVFICGHRYVVSNMIYVCVCVYMCVRAGERERERERKRSYFKYDICICVRVRVCVCVCV